MGKSTTPGARQKNVLEMGARKKWFVKKTRVTDSLPWKRDSAFSFFISYLARSSNHSPRTFPKELPVRAGLLGLFLHLHLVFGLSGDFPTHGLAYGKAQKIGFHTSRAWVEDQGLIVGDYRRSRRILSLVLPKSVP